MIAPQPSGATLYEALGGAERLRALVSRFVAEVAALPADASLRRMFPPARLERHRERLFEFLSGWLGGPPLYTQRHGLPNLRERHRHLAIGDAERDQWLACMRRALHAEAATAGASARLDAAFWTMANSLRNRDEPATGQILSGGRSRPPTGANGAH